MTLQYLIKHIVTSNRYYFAWLFPPFKISHYINMPWNKSLETPNLSSFYTKIFQRTEHIDFPYYFFPWKLSGLVISNIRSNTTIGAVTFII